MRLGFGLWRHGHSQWRHSLPAHRGFRSTEMRLDMSLIRAKATICEVEYVVFTQLLAVDYDVCAKRDAKFGGKWKITRSIMQGHSQEA